MAHAPDSGAADGIGALTGARWLAGLGVSLVSLAGVSVLTSGWDNVGAGARTAMLVAATVVIGLLLRPLRDRTPVTARMFDLLFAVMVPLDAAAVALTLGGGWPTASLTAGCIGLATGSVLRFHLGERTRIADGGLILAGGAIGIGLGGLTGLSAAVIVGALAVVGLIVAPWRSASIGWASLAALAPLVLTIEGSAVIGQGVLTRAGLLGDAVGPGAPIAAVLAAGVLLFFFLDDLDVRFLGAAVVALGFGSVATWAHFQPPNSHILPAAAGVFLLLELLAAGVRRPDLKTFTSRAAEAAEFAVGPLLTCFVIGRALETSGSAMDQAVVLAAAWMTMGWLLAAIRNRSLIPIAAAVATATSGLAAMSVPLSIIGSLLVVAGSALVIGTWRRATGTPVFIGASAATIGVWMIAADMNSAGLTVYIAPLALLLVLVGERAAMNSWAHWPTALALTTLAAVQGHVVTGLDRHLTFLTLCGIGATLHGALRSQAAPLLLGTALAIGVGGYQLLDVTVGLAAWGWLSIAGSTLLAIAAILEVTALPTEEHPAHLLEDITTRFR